MVQKMVAGLYGALMKPLKNNFNEDNYWLEKKLFINPDDELYGEWKQRAIARIRNGIYEEARIGNVLGADAREWLKAWLIDFAKHF